MPKVSQEHVAARRAQILDGARRAFARWGYEGATIARLEEETGLSRGAIFNYFESKEDLFVELAASDSKRYVTLLFERGLDETMRQMARESPEWLGVMLEGEARLRHDPGVEERLSTTPEEQDKMLAWFRARQEDGTFRSDVEAIELARYATIALNGLALRVVGGAPTDIEAMLRLLHGGMAPSPK